MSTLAVRLAEALGGTANISELEACMTRLRVVVHDPGQVWDLQLKSAGAIGVLKVGKAIQVILGTQADGVAQEIQTLLKR